MTLELHVLKSSPRKRHRRRGRGGSRGTYSGRGIKGQRARTGGRAKGKFAGKKVPTFILQLPKKRGFRSAIPKAEVVNLTDINRLFQAGDKITLELLRKKGLVRQGRNVKILGTGEMSKKVTVEAHRFSKSAKKKINQAGGQIKIVEVKP